MLHSPDALYPLLLLLERCCTHPVHGVLALDYLALTVRLARLDEVRTRGVQLEAMRLVAVVHLTNLNVTLDHESWFESFAAGLRISSRHQAPSAVDSVTE